MHLPKYNDTAFPSLPLSPPFFFEHMTANVFPMRSRLDALQTFVDNYLNIGPPEVGRFRAFLPYSFLMMLDYGRLAMPVSNLGWFAQREIMFSVPVEWYQVIDGRWVFKTWAWVAPFILVDSDTSLTLGRTVMGWPKVLCSVVPERSLWMQNPRSPTCEARIDTSVFTKAYMGSAPEVRTLLEIYREAPPTLSQIPLEQKSPFAPWTAAGNSVEALLRFINDFVDTLRGLGIMPVGPASDPSTLLRQADEAVKMINPVAPRLAFNTLNLKQFRDAGHPEEYCYQALTNGPMTPTRLNAVGTLGDLSMLAGNTSGGYSIRLHQWPSLPIAEILGLEAESSVHQPNVVTIKPTMPFWYDVNMRYERGQNLCWRSPITGDLWMDHNGQYDGPPSSTTCRKYNTTLGASSQTVAAPLRFTDSTMRVLPLLADRATLQKLLDGQFNRPLNDTPRPVGARFDVWSAPGTDKAYVYLVITSHGDVTSALNNIGSWMASESTFLVPVKLYRHEVGGWRLTTLGVVPVFEYSASSMATTSLSEVMGIPATRATFTVPANTWMQGDPSEVHDGSLLSVATDVLPAMDLGAAVEQRTVIDIHGDEMITDHHPRSWGSVAEQWAPVMLGEVERKWRERGGEGGAGLDGARALALEVLINGSPINVFTVKQFRDAVDPNRACFQAVLRTPWILEHVADLREMEGPMHVRIHEYASQPIVSLLGLEATLAARQSGGATYHLRPLRPFWIRVKWRQELADQMWARVGSDSWLPGQHLPSYFSGSDEKELPVGHELAQLVDARPSLNLLWLAEQYKTWGGENDPRMTHDTSRLTRGAARSIVERFDPQMVIERMLAREWLNAGQQARWRVASEEIERELQRRWDLLPETEQTEAELGYLRELIKGLDHDVDLGGHPPSSLNRARADLAFLEKLARWRREAREEIDAAIPPNSTEGGDRDDDYVTRIIGALESGPENLPLAEQMFPAKLLAEILAVAMKERPRDSDSHQHTHVAVRKRVQALVRREYDRQLQHVINSIAATSQKPDFCVPRGCAGTARDEAFPRSESWNDDWYVGPVRSWSIPAGEQEAISDIPRSIVEKS